MKPYRSVYRLSLRLEMFLRNHELDSIEYTEEDIEKYYDKEETRASIDYREILKPDLLLSNS